MNTQEPDSSFLFHFTVGREGDLQRKREARSACRSYRRPSTTVFLFLENAL
jgi:hypothetical protein